MRIRNGWQTLRAVSATVVGPALAVLCVTLAPTESMAQDSQYWTQQFGPRASLLSGAVIGSVSDISGTYYNPGSLGLAESLPFAISTNLFEFESLRLEDGAGSGVDLGTSRSGFRPSLLAGTITSNLAGGVLAYSALTRQRANSDISSQYIVSGSEVPPGTDLEDLVGIARVDGNLNEWWAGFTYSHAVSSRFGLGLTWYGAYRSQRRQREGLQETISTDGSPFVDIDIRGGRYSTLRTLAKIGGYFKSGAISGGVTVTTPSLHITGSGQFGVNIATFGVDTTVLAANVQTDLAAEYKSPLSVGFGLGWQIGSARLNASGEWFDRIDPYVVMEGEEFVTQEPSEVQQFQLIQAVDEVFNWALGLEYSFKGSVTGFASFGTDQTGFTDQIERADLSITNADLYSAFLGLDFMVSGARLTLGAGYGWGSSSASALLDVVGDENEGFEPRYVYRRLRILFGFELGMN